MEGQKHQGYADMLRALDSVYLRKTLHDRGLLYLYEEWPPPEFVGEDGDCEPDIIMDALHNLSEAVWSHYSDHDDTDTIYFSHPAIMEYYRLCRVWGKHRGIKLRDNPYMRQAEEFARSRLYQEGCFTCEYRLQTKINHRWASGIVFRMWPEFGGHLALFVQMAQVFGFYERETLRLKAELLEMEKQRNNERRRHNEHQTGPVLPASKRGGGRKKRGRFGGFPVSAGKSPLSVPRGKGRSAGRSGLRRVYPPRHGLPVSLCERAGNRMRKNTAKDGKTVEKRTGDSPGQGVLLGGLRR